jgi:hypothetical protein
MSTVSWEYYEEYTEPMKGKSMTHINYLMENVLKKPNEKIRILLQRKK